jgi:ABC-type phosphate/phosphonate transport system substrate-binding protein
MTAPRRWAMALPMYNGCAAQAEAGRELLLQLKQSLHGAGWDDAIDLVEAPADLIGFWRSPHMLLSQTCGYPLVTRLRQDVVPLATPHYGVPGCEDHHYRSWVVVREGGPLRDLPSLQGTRLAVNTPDSHSGMNALRHLLAPVAAKAPGRYFASVALSGSHARSLAMVQAGLADCAAVDCVSWAYLARQMPDAVQGLRVLAHTASAPCLPWITHAGLDPARRQFLMEQVLALPERAAAACGTLALSAFRPCTLADYAPIEAMEQAAVRLGYPELI